MHTVFTIASFIAGGAGVAALAFVAYVIFGLWLSGGEEP
jgi:hypothetical protein